jgi:hypothetical protein
MTHASDEHASPLQQWLPSARQSLAWFAAACLSALVWLYLIVQPSGYAVSFATPAGFGLLGAVLLLGVAFGSFGMCVYLIALAVIAQINPARPNSASKRQAARPALLTFLVHLAAGGLLAAFGMWRQPWPWYFGLVPFAWS